MGQKVNPHGLRVGVIKDWDSKWYAEGNFSDYLVEDYNIRKFLKKKLYSAGVSRIEIERASDRVKVIIYTAKPGVVIGKGGAEIEKVKKEMQKLTDNVCANVNIVLWFTIHYRRIFHDRKTITKVLVPLLKQVDSQFISRSLKPFILFPNLYIVIRHLLAKRKY